jgi:hypothetical protein
MAEELIKLQETALPVYGTKTGNTLFLKGKLQDTVPNKNGRVYGAEVWSTLHNSADFRNKLTNGLYLGKIMHPKDDEEFDPNLAAIVLREQSLVGTEVKGSIEVLRTPSGNILYTFNEARIRMGVSSRADGQSVKKSDGYFHVNPKMFIFSGYDVVLDPSVKDALPEYLLESDYKGNEINRLAIAIANRLVEPDEIDLRELQFYSSFVETATLDKESSTFSTLMESLNSKMSAVSKYTLPPKEQIEKTNPILPKMENGTSAETTQRITEAIDLATTKVKLENVTEKLTESKEVAKELKEANSKLVESVSAKDAEIVKLTVSLNEATQKVKATETAHQALQKRYDAATAVITELNESVDSTKASLSTLKESHKTTKSRLEKIEREHNAAKDIIDELEPLSEAYRSSVVAPAVSAKLAVVPEGELKTKLTESLNKAKTAEEVETLHEAFMKANNPNLPTPADIKKLNESTGAEVPKPLTRGQMIEAARNRTTARPVGVA